MPPTTDDDLPEGDSHLSAVPPSPGSDTEPLEPGQAWPVFTAEWRLAVALPSGFLQVVPCKSENDAWARGERLSKAQFWRVERRFITPWQAGPRLRTHLSIEVIEPGEVDMETLQGGTGGPGLACGAPSLEGEE